jgi:hypothetical protein
MLIGLAIVSEGPQVEGGSGGRGDSSIRVAGYSNQDSICPVHNSASGQMTKARDTTRRLAR